MKILFIIAWRNIWRHPARSGVLLAAIIVGLWAGVLSTGMVNGMMLQRMNYMIESEITHAQVHHPEFQAEGNSWLYIPEYEKITAWLNKDERVKSFTTRAITSGMLQSPVKTSGVLIRGIDSERERKTTTFHENMVEGEYLDNGMSNPVLLGKSLAEEHSMEIGDRIVLTFEDVNNELTSAAFNISGLFKSASSHFDNLNVFVRKEDLTQLLTDKPIVHEIAIMLDNEDHTPTIVNEINENFEGIIAKAWYEISPELGTLQAMNGLYIFILSGIILIALAFGILNTMLMALFERMQELGVLMSIGMSRIRIFFMITLEAIILSLSGSFVGIFLAIFTVRYLNNTGVNLEMFAAGIEEIGWPTVIYPTIYQSDFIAVVTLVIVIAIAASLYPAFKAFRLNPIEAAKDH